MVEPIFAREQVLALKPFIQQTVDEVLSKMIAKGCAEPVDLVAEFALPIPSYVSCSILAKDISETLNEGRLSIQFLAFHLKIFSI